MIAGAMASAIGFYTLSLHVSAERAQADRLRARIASDLRDIRALEAELRTRARLPVLQKWNDDVLALSAPTSKQFAGSAVQLAAFAPNAPAAVPTVPAAPAMQLALASEEELAVQRPGIVKASYQVPTAQLASYQPGPIRTRPEPVEIKPARAEIKPVKVEAKSDKVEPKQAAPVKLAGVKPKAASKSALDGLDSLASAIDSAAAAERGGFRKVSMQ